jgi:hypothetical protein
MFDCFMTLFVESSDGVDESVLSAQFEADFLAPDFINMNLPTSSLNIPCTWGSTHILIYEFDGTNQTIKLDGATIYTTVAAAVAITTPSLGINISASGGSTYIIHRVTLQSL